MAETGRNPLAKNFNAVSLIIITGIIIGLAITVIGLLFLDEIIWGLGASEILFPYCKDYLMIQLLFVVGNIMQVLYQNLFVTAGKPTLGLILSILAGIANIVFDYVFIVLLQMGIRGAAIGTSIGYMIPTLIGSIFFLNGKSELHFCMPKMDTSVLLKSCSNGASEMVSQLSTAVTTFLFNATMMKLLGEDGVAAITVIIYSQFLLTTLYIGFSMGVAPVISYNYGSGNVKQLKKVVQICIYFIMIISIFVFLFSGCNIFASALFTALSNGKVSATISFLRTFGFIMIFLLVLPRFLQVAGVWLAVPIAELLTLMLTAYLILRHRKNIKNFKSTQ